MSLTFYIQSFFITICILNISVITLAQSATFKGKVTTEKQSLAFTNVVLEGTTYGSSTDSSGLFIIKNLPPGAYKVIVSAIGYLKIEKIITLKADEVIDSDFDLIANNSLLDEVVISGTMKEVSKLESPVPVEIYTAKFFKSNPTPTIFDALQNVNGVRPQLNCNICSTGDIHINGLEGPYTMILIDGMPIVSGLSTVYGLSGIPQSLVDRVEIVKGPASTLYGSEAVGGLINIITKKTTNAALFSADIFGTSWGEINTDIAGKFKIRKNIQSFVGLNYFNYAIPIDHNQDGFTDVTLQNRASIFNKWNFQRRNDRIFTMAGRYVYENRWGGEMNWNKNYRGGETVYGESIYTKRWEYFGIYQLPIREKMIFQFSANGHDQNSVYGKTIYMAQQYVGFGQFTWNKQFENNDILLGTAFRYTNYDDNTPATAKYDTINTSQNLPSNTYLPGFFVQDEIRINQNNKLLLGMRYDYNSIHGSILTPRLNYKWNSRNKNNIMRFSFGNGYRVANVFTEDHAALTGSRQIEFLEDLRPETSWNGNINYVKKIFSKNGIFIDLDATAFYTFFNNKIIADYDSNPNKIIYKNLSGYAVSQGFSLNMNITLNNGLKLNLGGSLLDVYSVENSKKTQQMFTEHFTGVWSISYSILKTGLTFDYTGNVYSPMRLPLLSVHDPRNKFSPWWSIQNLQLTKKLKKGIEIYGGIKNLLNWTPNKGNPFIIARSHDPFDKEVQFDSSGQALVTPNNPYGLTFDPSYVYGPNQGIRAFLGIRYTLK